MKPTPLSGLVGVGGFFAAATLIIVQQFYASMVAVPASVAFTLWAMAVLCGVLAWSVKGKISDNRIGFDRSQLEPTKVAYFLVIAKASAWTGAIFSGIYIGMGVYVIPRISTLVAAAEDTPGIVAAVAGGIALISTALWLERCCPAPPPPDGEAVG